MSFYGIFIPSINGESNRTNDNSHVFSDRKEAFDMLKNHKEARLKVFKTSKEAEHFSHNGSEASTSSLLSTSSEPSLQSPTIPADKSPFRGPKSQDLVSFRKAIEQAKYDLVRETVWKNPRYLVGSGDTPTLLKESFRYNALHCAALAKNGKMCELLLQTIGNPSFIELLHGKQDMSICEEVSSILLDLYLNMPEKGRNETPLHLAVKFGAVDVVEVLTSYPQCLAKPNSDGLYPKDMICFRLTDPSKELVDQIHTLLLERFYVPVIRSVDNSTPPIIGEPFSTTNPPNLVFDPLSPEMEIQAYAGPMNKEQAQTFRRRWKTPPRLSKSSPNISPATSPSRQHSQYISPSQIRKFTPNKSTISMCSTPVSPACRKGARQLFANHSFDPSMQNNNKFMSLPLANEDVVVVSNNDFVMFDAAQPETQKHENEIETNASNLNHLIQMPPPSQIQQKPDIFGVYRNKRLISDQFNDSGSSSIHNLSVDSMFDSPMYKERHLKLADAEKGLEVFGRQLAREQNVNWKEYWSFLGGFIDISSESGLEKLESHLKKNKINRIGITTNNNDNSMNTNGHQQNMTPVPAHHNLSISSLCGALDKLNFRESRTLTNHRNATLANLANNNLPYDAATTTTLSSAAFNAYLCAEKSCQVYAKRMTKLIVQNLSSIILINDSLKSELKRLKSLISSYREDLRFYAVNFQSIHSRFANLIVAYLKYDHSDIDLNRVHDVLNQIYQSTKKYTNGNNHLASPPPPPPPPNASVLVESATIALHLDCLLIFLLHYLNHKDNVIAPEIFTTERDCADIWLTEQKCECTWDTADNSLRFTRSSIKRNAKRWSYNNNEQSLENQAVKKNVNDWRGQSNNDSDDEFLSDSGSENDLYFTPPQSPANLIDSDDSFEDCDLSFNNYILGEEPTKTDVDVINALLDTNIDQDLYPHVYEWKLAVLQHSVEERNNFPSPSIVVKGGRKTSDDRTVSGRLIYDELSVSQQQQQKQSKNNSINLSCMQVSSMISTTKSDSPSNEIEFKMKLLL